MDISTLRHWIDSDKSNELDKWPRLFSFLWCLS